MRILHVTHQYPPALGGSERYIADLSEELVRRSHQVDVFTSRSLDFHTWRDQLAPLEVRNRVNVYRFHSMQRRGLHWRMLHFGARNYWRTRAWPYELPIFLGGGPLCPRMFWDMLRKAPRYDLVHLNCLVYAHAAYGYVAARQRGVPIIVTPHAHTEQEITYGIGYQRAVLKGCDHALADTPGERAFLIDLGVNPTRITTGGTGLRPEDYPLQDQAEARSQLGLPPDAFVVLFLGRKSEYKGLDLALKAYKALLPDHPQLYLLAVGPGTDYSRQLLSDNQGLPGFRDLGAVSESVKLAALNASDCMALPSTGEAFGIVFLESWIMGKPVIGARTLAVSTVIDHGQDGFLVAPGDVNDLVNHLTRLLEDPDLAWQMGDRGRSKVLNRYTLSRLVDRIEGTYFRVLRRQQRDLQRRAA